MESAALLILLVQEGVCASSGSACLADSDQPLHVIKAMKPQLTASRQTIRFSLAATNPATNPAANSKDALTVLAAAVKMLRG